MGGKDKFSSYRSKLRTTRETLRGKKIATLCSRLAPIPASHPYYPGVSVSHCPALPVSRCPSFPMSKCPSHHWGTEKRTIFWTYTWTEAFIEVVRNVYSTKGWWVWRNDRRNKWRPHSGCNSIIHGRISHLIKSSAIIFKNIVFCTPLP